MKILGKKRVDRDFIEISISEFISITIGIISGVILLNIIDKVVLIPGLLILLPGFLEMHGNISGSLASRLSALLHTKKIKPITTNKTLRENVNASIILIIITSLILGIIAYFAVYIFFGITEFTLIYIVLFAAIIAIIIETPITVLTTLWLFKHNYDPDDIMGPYVTTMGDVISVLSLLLSIAILL